MKYLLLVPDYVIFLEQLLEKMSVLRKYHAREMFIFKLYFNNYSLLDILYEEHKGSTF